MQSRVAKEDVTVGPPAGPRPRTPHQGHGPREPAESVPEALPGSVRRTATLDILRPDGLDGQIVLRGEARDARWDDGGEEAVLAAVTVDATVAVAPAPTLVTLASRPARPALERLAGRAALSGLRGALRAAVPADFADAGLLALVLDDLPVAVLISGYANAVEPPDRRPAPYRAPPADICSGWRSDGTMMLTIARTGSLPVLVGPPAPDLDARSGPGNGRPPALPRQGMRRRRRMDVSREGGPGGSSGVLMAEASFRDSYRDAAGDEQIVHEYVLRARVRSSDMTILDLVAEPRVLPWQECPAAAASAGRLVGQRVGTFRERLRETFSGTSTCTHLNDLLRTLDDVTALHRALESGEHAGTTSPTGD